MKKDIPFLPVQGVQVVVARKPNELNQFDWQVFIINQNDQPMHTVFVTSTGYGVQEDKKPDPQKTSTLRHFFAELQPGEHQVVESIMPDVFHLNNEYWVSYYIDNQIFDKKFIFVPDSITEQHLVRVPTLGGLEGILHA
jgi:predicted DNA-binding protein (MmcQ/YjbR family)